jgi:Dual specificity phosphatase, catalytic domain
VISLVNGPLNLWRQTRFTDFITPDRHIWIECVDSPTQDLLVYMAGICDFIDQMLELAQQPPKGVLVHCDQGISRSSAVVIAYDAPAVQDSRGCFGRRACETAIGQAEREFYDAAGDLGAGWVSNMGG